MNAVRDQDWRRDASCAQPGVDPAWFHPETGRGALSRPTPELRAALACCASCLVMRPCRAWAYAVEDQHAILGGMSATQRRRMLREAAS